DPSKAAIGSSTVESPPVSQTGSVDKRQEEKHEEPTSTARKPEDQQRAKVEQSPILPQGVQSSDASPTISPFLTMGRHRDDQQRREEELARAAEELSQAADALAELKATHALENSSEEEEEAESGVSSLGPSPLPHVMKQGKKPEFSQSSGRDKVSEQ